MPLKIHVGGSHFDGLNPLTSKSDWHLISHHNNKRIRGNNENKGNGHHLEKLWIMKQILLISTLGNV